MTNNINTRNAALTTYSDWREWRNDYYDRLMRQGKNAATAKRYGAGKAERNQKLSDEADAARTYYERVVVPASTEFGGLTGGQFDASKAANVIAAAPPL